MNILPKLPVLGAAARAHNGKIKVLARVLVSLEFERQNVLLPSGVGRSGCGQRTDFSRTMWTKNHPFYAI